MDRSEWTPSHCWPRGAIDFLTQQPLTLLNRTRNLIRIPILVPRARCFTSYISLLTHVLQVRLSRSRYPQTRPVLFEVGGTKGRECSCIEEFRCLEGARSSNFSES